jgi:hypothetical protein
MLIDGNIVQVALYIEVSEVAAGEISRLFSRCRFDRSPGAAAPDHNQQMVFSYLLGDAREALELTPPETYEGCSSQLVINAPSNRTV